MSLLGRVALITGSSRGIGRAIALALAEDGADIAVNFRRDTDAAQDTVTAIQNLGRRAQAFQASVDRFDEDKSMVGGAIEAFGHIDILVNNAGVIDGDPIDKLTLEKWRATFSVNVDGLMMCTREAFKIMKAQGGGRIINIGSIAADRPSARRSTQVFPGLSWPHEIP